jgi:hypothetical protein
MNLENFQTRDADVLVNRIAAHVASLLPRAAHLSDAGREALARAVVQLASACAELRLLPEMQKLENVDD